MQAGSATKHAFNYQAAETMSLQNAIKAKLPKLAKRNQSKTAKRLPKMLSKVSPTGDNRMRI